MAMQGKGNSVEPARRPLAQSHPWHGISPGTAAPNLITTFIEIVPTDPVKYEVDKDSGFLRIDRPQQYSNHCPTLYGFLPQSYCGDLVGKYCAEKVGREKMEGDGDPLDICVISERPILHGNVLLDAIPFGGLRMIDRNEADDKILAVLKDDILYGSWSRLADCPNRVIDRLRHYFLTYKSIPMEAPSRIEIAAVYDVEEAKEVIRLSLEDYRNKFHAS